MRIRFSLRSIVLLVLIAAVSLCPFSMRALRQKLTVDRNLAAGGTAMYDEGGDIGSRSFLVHWLHPVKYVQIRPSKEFPVEAQLRWLTELPQVEVLSIEPKQKSESGLTDAGAQVVVEHLGRLKLLQVEGATCSNKSLRQVRDALSQTRGWIHRANGWGLLLNNEKSTLYRAVENFRLQGD